MQKTVNNELLAAVLFIFIFVLILVALKGSWESFKQGHKEIFGENSTRNVVKSDAVKCTNCSVLYDSEDSFCGFCGIKRGETK